MHVSWIHLCGQSLSQGGGTWVLPCVDSPISCSIFLVSWMCCTSDPRVPTPLHTSQSFRTLKWAGWRGVSPDPSQWGPRLLSSPVLRLGYKPCPTFRLSLWHCTRCWFHPPDPPPFK